MRSYISFVPLFFVFNVVACTDQRGVNPECK